MSSNTRSSDRWVGEGLRLQSLGDLVRAEAAFRRALSHQPQQPSALYLLGVLLRRLGRAAEAESCLRESLAIDPKQAPAWNLLGNLLVSAAQPQDAVPCFDAALVVEPEFYDAHFNRARALRQLGRLGEALEAVRRAGSGSVRLQASVLHLEALIRADQGNIADAVLAMGAALQLEPAKTALVHDLATLYQRAHRPVQALDLHEQALSLGLDAADAHYNRGNTLQSLGRHAEALQAYRQALQRDPQHALALFDLARLRWRLGEPDFDSDFRRALAARPEQIHIAAELGHLLYRAERFADASQVYRQALQHAPAQALLHSGLGRTLARQQLLDEAIAAHRRAAQLAPADATVRASLAEALLQARKGAEALAELELARSCAPDDQYVLALQGLAWRQLDDPRAAWLNDISRLVLVDDLPAPEGFADMGDFNAALLEELAPLHCDLAAPVDQSLRRGTQTLGDIFEQGHVLVDALKQRIRESVDRYIAALPRDALHPFLARQSPRWRFTDSWSSRLGRGGFHTNHVHPHGWLSSAYYVQVPAVAADPARQQGWIQFGAPDFDLGLALPTQRTVQPRAGRLVLFPSMMWHGTTPFDDAEARTTIAFDVVPLGS